MVFQLAISSPKYGGAAVHDISVVTEVLKLLRLAILFGAGYL